MWALFLTGRELTTSLYLHPTPAPPACHARAPIITPPFHHKSSLTPFYTHTGSRIDTDFSEELAEAGNYSFLFSELEAMVTAQNEMEKKEMEKKKSLTMKEKLKVKAASVNESKEVSAPSTTYATPLLHIY